MARGSTNVFVPGAGVVYAAPELILHYIDEHQYQPPLDFCDALLRCPPMGTVTYLDALLSNASGDFRRYIEWCLADRDYRDYIERRLDLDDFERRLADRDYRDYIERRRADPDVRFESERQRLGMDRPTNRKPLGGLVVRLLRTVMGKAKAVRS